MNILDTNINRYLSEQLPEREPILLEMEQYAHEHNFPIIGPLVGRICFLMAKVINAKNIFEMGSGLDFDFGAICQ